jgi:hypothetical protein
MPPLKDFGSIAPQTKAGMLFLKITIIADNRIKLYLT